MERIVVETYDDDENCIKKAFVGRWLVEGMESEESDIGWHWSVAQTEKGNIVVYSFLGDTPDMGCKTTFRVFAGLEDAEGEVPDDVLSAAASAMGVEFVQELDI